MTHIEFNACTVENEILRDRLHDNRKTAQHCLRMLDGWGGYVCKSQIQSLRDLLKQITQ